VPRVALVSSEPLRTRAAGIGIRYLEMARRLPAAGIDVVAVSPADPETVPLPEGTARRFVAGRLPEIVAGCDAAVAQGQLANDLLLECPELPTAIDLYDPWLVENLHYLEDLGLDPYRNDHATWVLQLSRGDFFLCSSEEQRLYYEGFLTALGRVNPHRLRDDPDLTGLIAPVPFGVPRELPPHEPYLDPPADGERRLLFGGLYDWYDPDTLLDALERLETPGAWRLLFIRNPNPGATPQRLLRRVERRCRDLGWWGERVELIDWVPAERRWDLLRDVDALVAPHRPSLETRLSMRTRFLEAVAAGCPVITSEGGTVSRLLVEHGAGWVAPPEDPGALSRALDELLAAPRDASAHEGRQRGAEALARRFTWDRVLEPLIAFCRTPKLDSTKRDFAYQPPTVAPPDTPGFRLRRRLRRSALGPFLSRLSRALPRFPGGAR
jgi:glycosyltransferase involved in cell wall biosynthesis